MQAVQGLVWPWMKYCVPITDQNNLVQKKKTALQMMDGNVRQTKVDNKEHSCTWR